MAKLHKNNAKIHLEAPITTAIGHLDQQHKMSNLQYMFVLYDCNLNAVWFQNNRYHICLQNVTPMNGI